MTIEQRLEALVQTVELLSHMHQDMNKEYEKRFQQNEERMGQLMETMNRLATIVISHEERLDKLDGGAENPSY